MTKKTAHAEFESNFRLFVNRQYNRKFGARLVRRGAACQEFVRFQTDIVKDNLEDRETIAAVWKGVGENTRIFQLDFNITGPDTIEIQVSPDSLLMSDLVSCTYCLPIALCVEPREAILDVAKCAIPDWTDAYTAAGMIQGQRMILAKAISQPLEVPASCKMVFEGYIEKKEAATGGETVRMHVSCITGQI